MAGGWQGALRYSFAGEYLIAGTLSRQNVNPRGLTPFIRLNHESMFPMFPDPGPIDPYRCNLG